MGILTRSLGFQASMEDPAQPLLPMSAMFESMGLGRSDAGVNVNEKAAMRLSPVFASWKIISEDLSKIPLSVYQTLPDGSVRLAAEHPVHRLIHDQPNEIMTAISFRGALITSALAYGNGFAFINRNQVAKPISLHLLPSDKTSAVMVDGNFGFATTATATGVAKWIDPDNVIHLLGLSFDGITGYSPVSVCNNVFGVGLAAEKFAAQFFGNGARATGVLTHPLHLQPEAYANLKQSVREWATGDNALRPIVLEEGLKWEQITINPDEGQVLETRKFQVEEIARLYRIPLHKLGELTRSTNNNIEHQGIEHNQDALQPWAVKLEQEVNRKLLSGRYFAEHDFSELERGDAVATAQSIQVLRNSAIYSTNDGLRKLRMNTISEEEGGDVRIVNGANIPLTALVDFQGNVPLRPDVKAPNQITAPDPAAYQKAQILSSYRRLIRDAVGRSINRNSDQAFVSRAMQPILAAMRESLNVSALGSSTLNDSDERLVKTLTSQIAADASGWTRENASSIADELAEAAYAALKHA